ncbi:MAG TPA: citrate/2-methylcitrate synthase, partial [Acidobacteriota bacterium]
MANSQANKGLEGIVAAETKISHVDGLAGELIIGGYALEEIAGKASYDEVAYLLWNLAMGKPAELPKKEKLQAFEQEVSGLRNVPEAALAVVKAARDAAPMDALRMAVGMLSLDDPQPGDESLSANLQRAKSLTSRIPTLIAAHDRARRGLEPIQPDPALNRAANFLYMLNGQKPHPELAHALDTYWTTVVDHGMNASTFTARVIASTESDMYSAITGAIGALKGPLHGGAPGPVLNMLVDIKTIDRAENWVRNEIAAGKRIMGFGHRVYKVRDPRADVLKKAVDELAASGKGDQHLFPLATGVEKIILRVLEEVKPGRKLNTNVEFYTALV